MTMSARRPSTATRMNHLHLEEVEVLLGESRTQIRIGLKGALAEAGLRNVTDVSNLKALQDNITQAIGPDIVICDTGLPGERGICDVVRKVRNKEIGRNPFLCIIAVTWNPTPEEVDQVIGSGVDALLAAPFAPQQIIDRVDALVHKRKPFLVTSDYVGPDRRLESDTRETKIPMMDAPNTLRSKALGNWNIAEMRESIEQASGEIKFQKVERQASDISHIVEQIIAQSTMPGPDMTTAHLERLHELLAALDDHAYELEMPHLCDLCESARDMVNGMRRGFGARREKDLQLLHQIAQAIVAGALPRHRKDESLAHDIAKTIKNAS